MFYGILITVLISFVWIAMTILKEEKRLEMQKQRQGVSVHKFAVKVCKLEGKKKQVNIAQVKEVLKVVNQLLDGELYKIIHNGTKKKSCCK